MTFLADDDVIVHRNAERLRYGDDLLRHLDVGARRCRIAGRVVVDQNDGGSGQFQRAFDHFARIDGRMVDGAGLLHLVGNNLVSLVEKKNTELLAVLESLRRTAIIEHRRPG